MLSLMKMLPISILLLTGFLLSASGQVREQSLQAVTLTVRFKVEDYNPTTRYFLLVPQKKSGMEVIYQPASSEQKFPALLQEIGDTVTCVVSTRSAGVAPDGQPAFTILFTCGEEQFIFARHSFTGETNGTQ